MARKVKRNAAPRPTFAAVPPSPSSLPPTPRAAAWLVGAAVLALAVQAIFVLVPAPQSASAADAAAPPDTPSLASPGTDSTAFTLEDASAGPALLQPDTAGTPAPDTAQTAAAANASFPAPAPSRPDSLAPARRPLPAPLPDGGAPGGVRTTVPLDTVPATD